jgi:hypothetical protein
MALDNVPISKQTNLSPELVPSTVHYVLYIFLLVHQQHEKRLDGISLHAHSTWTHVALLREKTREKRQLIASIECCVQVAGSDSSLTVEVVTDRAIVNAIVAITSAS